MKMPAFRFFRPLIACLLLAASTSSSAAQGNATEQLYVQIISALVADETHQIPKWEEISYFVSSMSQTEVDSIDPAVVDALAGHIDSTRDEGEVLSVARVLVQFGPLAEAAIPSLKRAAERDPPEPVSSRIIFGEPDLKLLLPELISVIETAVRSAKAGRPWRNDEAYQ